MLIACTICGQTFPVVPTAEDAEIVTCLRCGTRFAWDMTASLQLRLDGPHGSRPSNSSAVPFRSEPPPIVADDDDWDDMYQPAREWSHKPSAPLPVIYRVDPAERQAEQPVELPRVRSNRLQWLILSLGAATFSCGAALVAWSFGEDRQELWNIGAPLALAGQAAFLIGLVLQLDILWQQNRQTSQHLDRLRQMSPIRPDSGRSVAASELSDSVARPASDTDSLLNELKVQLDRMATRLTHTEP